MSNKREKLTRAMEEFLSTVKDDNPEMDSEEKVLLNIIQSFIIKRKNAKAAPSTSGESSSSSSGAPMTVNIFNLSHNQDATANQTLNANDIITTKNLLEAIDKLYERGVITSAIRSPNYNVPITLPLQEIVNSLTNHVKELKMKQKK